ncbi:MAG: M23 family metallopeptidase [Chroococcidiopsidaceae cyanobacterium CP_BM_RX_35]|nr:M23 family metallopeptidase [Chroococcidiopsidaceae cyanobacterium CP_BM_RX_35]
MKRASTKKVKARPVGASCSSDLGGFLQLVRSQLNATPVKAPAPQERKLNATPVKAPAPQERKLNVLPEAALGASSRKLKWRVRTSAAMTGLAVSLGASSLLMPGQSGYSALAAGPVRNDPITSMVPAPTKTATNLPTNLVQKAGGPVINTENVNAGLKANHQAKHSLAELKSEESNNLSVNSIRLAEPSVQNLQTEVQRLQEKYSNQPINRQASSDAAVPLSSPAPTTFASEPINLSQPELLLAQAAELLQPVDQAQPLTTVSPTAPALAQPLATAPMDGEMSAPFQFLSGQTVSPGLPPLAAADIYLPKSLIAFKGYIWPTKGVLTSPFGWRWGHIHPGIDIAAPVGTPVFAAAPGVVITASWNSGGYGNLVDIRHPDGSLTRYGHNSRLLVRVGQQVQQGQEISEMGSTGFSTGPHCHFEVHPPGHGAVNPIAYLPH